MERMLPIGVQSFRKLRQEGRHYVDKTDYIGDLLRTGTHYFLSRPRRFGKSLLASTLHSLFACERELFGGLAIEQRWNWSEPSPVVHLDLSGGSCHESGTLQRSLSARLGEIEEDAGIEPKYADATERFAFLIRQLHRTTGRRVAVLVDEYDKPILDVLDDPETACANRNFLRELYAVIKRCDEHVRFCLLTGVSKFSKVSLFSGLNNLKDITLAPRYSSICGYTESDLDTVFAAELQGLDRERIREWYNGYNWGGDERVYNPFDVLLLLGERQFKPWWFETGTPSFLVQLLARNAVSSADLQGMLASERLLGAFDVGRIEPAALLFQTGYLTIGGQEWRNNEQHYRLVYPNLEVRQGLNLSLRDYLTGYDRQREAHHAALGELLRQGDLDGLAACLRALFASIPSDWHRRNRIAEYEGYYASVVHAYFAGLGLAVTVEDSSSGGRLDMAVRSGGRVYLFEFKLAGKPGAALAQLKGRGYADKYRHLGEPIHLIGVEFDPQTRAVSDFETELVPAAT